MKCVHCGFELEGTEVEVCRHCKPAFSKRRGPGGLRGARCPACEADRAHDPADLKTADDRLRYVP